MDSAEALVDMALTLVRREDPDRLTDALDALPAPIYVTRPDGAITHYNQACLAIAAGAPDLKHDRWCVSLRLFTVDGEPLPHDQCPMARAIRERRPIRNVEAIAERPDGGRVRFLPFPTPYFDEDGNVAGAINLLLDISCKRHADALLVQAARCRRLAESVADRQAMESLTAMALEYETQAGRNDTRH